MQKAVFLSVFHENTNKVLGFGEDLAVEDCDLILYLRPAVGSRTRPRTQSRALLQVKTLSTHREGLYIYPVSPMLPKQVAQSAVARVAASHCSELSPQSVEEKKGISRHDVFYGLV